MYISGSSASSWSARINVFPFASRCREVEQDVATLKAQLVEKQAVQTENERLKLQLESALAHDQMEQRKAGEDRSEAAHTHTHISTYIEVLKFVKYEPFWGRGFW